MLALLVAQVLVILTDLKSSAGLHSDQWNWHSLDDVKCVDGDNAGYFLKVSDKFSVVARYSQ